MTEPVDAHDAAEVGDPGPDAAGAETADPVGAEDPRPIAPAGPRFPWRAIALVALFVLTLAAVAGIMAKVKSSTTELSYTIPAGTGQRLDSGEQIQIIPASLGLKVGDSITVRNDDDRLHTVGPFAVREKETLTYRFSNPGVYKGLCTVHPSGEVVITVT